MLLGHLDICGTARSGHKGRTLLQALHKLGALLACCCHSTLRNLDNICKTYRLDSAIYLINGGIVLRQHSGCNHSYNFLAIADSLQDVEYLRNLEDSTERAAVHTLTAVDTLLLVDMLHAKLVLCNSTYGARLLARYGDMHDSVVGAVVVTHTAADTELCVDTALACLGVKVDSIAGTAHRARTRNATTAQVCNGVVGMYARRASLVNYAHNVILWLLSLHSTVEVLRQRSELVRLVLHIKA